MKKQTLSAIFLAGVLLMAGCKGAQQTPALMEKASENGAATVGELSDVQTKEVAQDDAVVSDEEFFKKLEETMSSEIFFELMVQLVATEDIEAIVTGLNGLPCIYQKEAGFVSNYTGTAVGFYPYAEDEYGIYYGEYENGQRVGQSKYFAVTDQSFYVYSGEWAGDKPNGQGNQSEYHRSEDGSYEKDFYVSVTGTYVDGLENGEFSGVVVDLQDYSFYMGYYTAKDGLASAAWEANPGYQGREDLQAGTGGHIYAVCVDETTGKEWWLTTSGASVKLGVPGFIDAE